MLPSLTRLNLKELGENDLPLTGADVDDGGGGGLGLPGGPAGPPNPPYLVDNEYLLKPFDRDDPTWHIADRSDPEHHTGVAILAYTNEMSSMMIAQERNMLASHFVANREPIDVIDRMCPYLAFFAPLVHLDQLMSVYQLDAIYKEFVHLELIVGPAPNFRNCTTRLLLTNGYTETQEFSLATNLVHATIKLALFDLYNIPSVVPLIDSAGRKAQFLFVQESMKRMLAAFQSGLETTPVSELTRYSRGPIGLYRGMKDVALNSSLNEVLRKLQTSYSSWTTDKNVAAGFAAAANNLSVMLHFVPDAERGRFIVAIVVDKKLPRSWQCNAYAPEHEVIVPSGTAYVTLSSDDASPAWTFVQAVPGAWDFSYRFARVGMETVDEPEKRWVMGPSEIGVPEMDAHWEIGPQPWGRPRDLGTEGLPSPLWPDNYNLPGYPSPIDDSPDYANYSPTNPPSLDSPNYSPNTPPNVPNTPPNVPNTPPNVPNPPPYVPNTPPYVPNPPPYVPNTPPNVPNTPPNVPNTPPYVPNTPGYDL
jgi:hypothetical protein